MTETQRLKLDLSITIAGITSIVLRFYILLSLWEWFVMPIFNIRAITVIELMGLLVGWAIFAKNPSGEMMLNKYRDDKLMPKKEKFHAELTKLLTLSLIFSVGLSYWWLVL